MTTGERIKKRRTELCVSADELAQQVGLSRSTIFRYENGDIEKVPAAKLEPIAKALKTTVSYLMGWTDGADDSNLAIYGLHRAERANIGVIGKVPCGDPATAVEEYTAAEDVSNPLHADYCLRASGDSMENIGIKDGTIVFVRKQDTVDNGDVAVVLIDDEVTLKRVYQYGNTLVLRPENPKYKEMTIPIDGSHNIRILGKAVSYQNYVI